VQFIWAAAVPGAQQHGRQRSYQTASSCSPDLQDLQASADLEHLVPLALQKAEHDKRLASMRERPFEQLPLQLCRRFAQVLLSLMMPKRKDGLPFSRAEGEQTTLADVVEVWPSFPAVEFEAWSSTSGWSQRQTAAVARAAVSESGFFTVHYPRLIEKLRVSPSERGEVTCALQLLRREQQRPDQSDSDEMEAAPAAQPLPPQILNGGHSNCRPPKFKSIRPAA
jgi:hypothetical protein